MQIYKEGPELIELIEQFKRLPLLQAFEGRVLEQILSAGSMNIYGPDELIIAEDAPGDRLYVLLKGKVRIVKLKNPIAVLDQVGEIFGELSMFDQQNRTASVYAAETACCLELNPGLLQKLPRAERDACHALLYRFIAQVIAGRLMKTTAELAVAADDLAKARRKIAEQLTKVRESPGREDMLGELDLAIGQLQWTKEKLARLSWT